MERKITTRFWKALACAMAIAACLALAACGGNSGGSSSAASSTASSTASSAASSEATSETGSSATADPAEKFVGTWKLAGADMEGITVVGDFSAGILGEDISMTLDLAQDGTGSTMFDGETADVTWEATGDDAISITPASTDGDLDPMTAAYEDGVLAINMDDDDFDGTIYLTATGKLEGKSEITAANATDITSEADLVGTWRLSGMSMMGMSMYGDADDLAEQVGDSEYTTLEINADGTAAFMGEDVTWEVGSDGAVIAIEGSEVPLKSLDGGILVDVGSLMGEAGIDFDMIMLYSK